MVATSYVLPYRSDQPPSSEFIAYVNELSTFAEVLLIDGSPDAVYAAMDARCAPGVRHLRPDADFAALRNGKVRGVLTGLWAASHEYVVLADDDVRYTPEVLAQVTACLHAADVVRPQNYFEPLPWHALIDTARTLLNRITGGDWPGTLAVRRSTLMRTDGYDGNVLFENLELVRTVEAIGGREWCRRDLFVQRLPPTARHFWRQRVRQAYDEFARPWRLLLALTIVPVLIGFLATGHGRQALILAVAPIIVAECGRRRARGTRRFPFAAALVAPCWVLERGICAWLAVAARVGLGGMPYSGRVLKIAANSSWALARRHLRGRIAMAADRALVGGARGRETI